MLKRLFYILLMWIIFSIFTPLARGQGLTIGIEYNPIHSRSNLGDLQLSEWALDYGGEFRISRSFCYLLKGRLSVWNTKNNILDITNSPFFMAGGCVGIRLLPDARSRLKLVFLTGVDLNLSKDDLFRYDDEKKITMEMPLLNTYAIGGIELYLTNKICIRPQIKLNQMFFSGYSLKVSPYELKDAHYSFYSFGLSINYTLR